MVHTVKPHPLEIQELTRDSGEWRKSPEDLNVLDDPETLVGEVERI